MYMYSNLFLYFENLHEQTQSRFSYVEISFYRWPCITNINWLCAKHTSPELFLEKLGILSEFIVFCRNGYLSFRVPRGFFLPPKDSNPDVCKKGYFVCTQSYVISVILRYNFSCESARKRVEPEASISQRTLRASRQDFVHQRVETLVYCTV